MQRSPPRKSSGAGTLRAGQAHRSVYMGHADPFLDNCMNYIEAHESHMKGRSVDVFGSADPQISSHVRVPAVARSFSEYLSSGVLFRAEMAAVSSVSDFCMLSIAPVARDAEPRGSLICEGDHSFHSH
jgi:hypothetical protein